MGCSKVYNVIRSKIIHYLILLQVHKKNTIQIIAFILFNLCCFSYAVFQFKQIHDAIAWQFRGDTELVWELRKIMIANPVVIGICQLVYFYLGARLYLEFG